MHPGRGDPEARGPEGNARSTNSQQANHREWTYARYRKRWRSVTDGKKASQPHQQKSSRVSTLLVIAHRRCKGWFYNRSLAGFNRINGVQFPDVERIGGRIDGA